MHRSHYNYAYWVEPWCLSGFDFWDKKVLMLSVERSIRSTNRILKFFFNREEVNNGKINTRNLNGSVCKYVEVYMYLYFCFH